MPPASDVARSRRTWPQRLVLVGGVLVILLAATTAAAAGYLGFRFGQIDRVDDLALADVASGEPANVLIVGTDSRDGISEDDPDSVFFLGDGATGCDCTDTIMVVRIDPEGKTANILSFPRDLYLPISGTGESARINSAHANGVQTLIDTIQDNFGIPINHYIEVDFVGFQKLVDSVGGVPMWFDTPVRDRHTGLQIDQPGCVTLDGEQARRFVRARYLEHQDEDGDWSSPDPSADLGRITRQQIFVRRAAHLALSKGLSNPVTLNDLVAAGVANVKLDGALSAGDILAIGRAFASFDADDLEGFTIPTDPRGNPGGGYGGEVADLREAEPILNVFRGLPRDAVSPGSVGLTVFNGTAVDGEGSNAAAALATVGFPLERVASYDRSDVTRTTVFYGDGGLKNAELVARYLTGGAALVYDVDVEDGEAVLVVGSDFTTVHDQPTPEGAPEEALITTSTETTVPGDTTTTTEDGGTTTTTTVVGYATGEPPPGASCG